MLLIGNNRMPGVKKDTYMTRHERIEEWALKQIGNGYDLKTLFFRNTMGHFISGDHIYLRGKEIEDRTLAETGDEEAAWYAAEPYYDAARLKNNKDAWFRYAEYAYSNEWIEFVYAYQLGKAAKLGHKQAIHDYVYKYDEFKAKTITKDAYKEKKRQEKLYFRCCKALAAEGDLYALWELGTCFSLGCGVKKDLSKAIQLKEEVLERGEFTEEERSRRQEIIDFDKMCYEKNR